MKRKTIFIATFIIFFFCFLFFFFFKSNDNDELIKKRQQTELIKNENVETIDEIIESSNIIEDVSYSAKDTKGNEYFLKASEGTIDQN